MTVTPEEILELLRQVARRPGGFILSVHAASRAAQRGIARRDIASAFLTARHATKQDNGNWRIKGLDDDGSELEVIVLVGDRNIVITVI